MNATPTDPSPLPFLQLVAHEQRWRLLEALARSDRRVHELVERVGEPANLVSYHLRRLRSQDLVRERRSAADRRDVYYSLDLERMHELFLAAGASLHPGLGATLTRGTADREGLGRGVRVLFLCTHNSARSQMAEAMLRTWGGDHFDAFSAGTHATSVRPEAVEVMREVGIDISTQRSKGIDRYAGQSFEWVITVCETARQECPVFPGVRHSAHWGIDDPSKVEGDEATRLAAFRAARDELRNRVRLLLTTARREAVGHPSAERLPETL